SSNHMPPLSFSGMLGGVQKSNPEWSWSYRSQSSCSNVGECSQALLGGCSAGGLTTILHCDSFRSLLPASAKVKCFSDAGYFIDA
ncbi:hypothetical protein BHE74_00050686, partial [Ensete ventricosum]